ncbi:transcription termination factor MTEF1, chloroplastic [Humulus lupulus]|uniref:transcription termination factor MTEF1, chloroplastic n=1 Tax=Humulus lupulus TaxID=3486 RepID=UPI002B4164EC|nr:transcription termination factor MTEF1, chloroplastic [Humulus lupulus]
MQANAMLQLHSYWGLHLNLNPNSKSYSLPPSSTRFIKFRTSHRENLRYLKTIGIIHPHTPPNKLPLPDHVDHIIAAVHFLKSKGFSDSHFSRLAFLRPQLFSPKFDPTHVEPVFDFLAADVSASPEASCSIILRCPAILFSDVEYCLRPTLAYLRELGLSGLNSATNLNAHLLNTRVEKLREKVRFLRSIGLSYEESGRVCARVPAIFGYSIEDNLRPKHEYLVWEMERSLEEVNKFPQYFGFSLEKRIRPRHIHLKQRNVHIPLNRMLLWGDHKFYAKWK